MPHPDSQRDLLLGPQASPPATSRFDLTVIYGGRRRRLRSQ